VQVWGQEMNVPEKEKFLIKSAAYVPDALKNRNEAPTQIALKQKL
jgi:hypothetical protein